MKQQLNDTQRLDFMQWMMRNKPNLINQVDVSKANNGLRGLIDHLHEIHYTQKENNETHQTD